MSPIEIYGGGVWRLVSAGTPSVPVDVLLVAGQSNAQGKALLANLPSSLSGPRANVNIWDGTKFVALEAKTNSGYPQVGQDWGLEMLLGELAAAKSGKPVYIIKHAIGGTGLTTTGTNSWNPASSTGLYAAFKSNITAALAALSNAGKAPTVRGFVWVQGEEDSKSDVATVYENKQTTLFNGIRSHVGVPDLKIVDGLLRGEFSTYVYTPQINTAKTNVAAALGNVRTVRSSAFDDVGDDVHYDGAAQLALGRHAYEYLYGVSWALPAAVPARAFEFDVSRQSGFDTQALLKLGTLFDHSGNGRHFSQAVLSKTPGVVEGPLGLGMGTLRFVSPNGLDGPVSPFADDSPFTVYYVIANLASAAGVRTVMRSLAAGGWLLWYPNTGATDKIALRGRNSTMLIQSSVATGAAPQVVIVSYGGAAGSYIRINGTEVATSTVSAGHVGGGAMQIGDVNASLTADEPALGAVPAKLTTAQAQTLEAALAWRNNLQDSLPSSHPFHNSPPA